jgi:hypothetical protein
MSKLYELAVKIGRLAQRAGAGMTTTMPGAIAAPSSPALNG